MSTQTVQVSLTAEAEVIPAAPADTPDEESE